VTEYAHSGYTQLQDFSTLCTRVLQLERVLSLLISRVGDDPKPYTDVGQGSEEHVEEQGQAPTEDEDVESDGIASGFRDDIEHEQQEIRFDQDYIHGDDSIIPANLPLDTEDGLIEVVDSEPSPVAHKSLRPGAELSICNRPLARMASSGAKLRRSARQERPNRSVSARTTILQYTAYR